MSGAETSDSPNDTRELLPLVGRGAGIALLGFLITFFFYYLGFPYDLLAENVVRQIESRSEARVAYGSVGPDATWLGPGIAVEQVAWLPSDGEAVELGDVTLRPAWSTSWFRGVPAVHIATSADWLTLNLTLWVEDPISVEGSLEELNLADLSGAGSLDRARLDGRLEMDFELEQTQDGGWQGTAQVLGKEGSFTPPDIGVAIPFDRFESALSLPGDGFIHVESATIEAPILSVAGQGRVQWPPGGGTQTLDLQAELHLREPSLHGAFTKAKIRLDRDGKGKLRIGGTLAKPTFR